MSSLVWDTSYTATKLFSRHFFLGKHHRKSTVLGLTWESDFLIPNVSVCLRDWETQANAGRCSSVQAVSSPSAD